MAKRKAAADGKFFNGGSVARMLDIGSHHLLYKIRAHHWPKADVAVFNERLWSNAAVRAALEAQLKYAQECFARYEAALRDEAFDASQLLGNVR